jgi:hypothetical protein
LLEHKFEGLKLAPSGVELNPVFELCTYKLRILDFLLNELYVRKPEMSILVQRNESSLIKKLSPLEQPLTLLKFYILHPCGLFSFSAETLTPHIVYLFLKGDSLSHPGNRFFSYLSDFLNEKGLVTLTLIIHQFH